MGRRETVRLIVEPDTPRTSRGSIVAGITTRWNFDEPLPENIDTQDNLAWKAVDLVVDVWRSNRSAPTQPLPTARIEVDKTIFIAGGMAGGSADAAAALVAARDFIRHHAGGPEPDIKSLAPQLGADVPFALNGGSALGHGRGDTLRPIDTRHRFWWVFVNPATTLSTETCFATLDSLREDNPELEPNLDPASVTEALHTGEPHILAAALHNDLELPARLLRPQIGDVLDHGNTHALRAIVSGSGPTVAMLCES